jgi:hypothetical protein
MSKLNPVIKKNTDKFEATRLAGGFGALAAKQDPESLLRRAVFSCLLFEDLAYESGENNAENIAALIPKVEPEKVAQIALEARKDQKLRHVPLFILSEMAKYPKHKQYVSDYLKSVITRPDMITDFVSLYWKNGKKPLANQVKKGLAQSFNNFNEFQFAKYDRDAKIKLRDVMFLVRPNPQDNEQEKLFKKIADRTLATPDTWEVELSKSTDKKGSWTRLIKENKLGALAFLRNLRNFKEAGVDHNLIREGFKNVNSSMLLPLNFLAARQHAPEFESEIEALMIRTYSNLNKLPGYTVFVVDVSGSMGCGLSAGSSFDRLANATAMALLARNQCEKIDIFCTAGSDGTRIHQTSKIDYPANGFKLIDQINEKKRVLGGGGIFTSQCLDYIKDKVSEKPDRIIVFSDSQDCSMPKVTPKPFGKNNYIVDVSAHQHGINYKGVWTAEIAGHSDHFLTFISSMEGVENEFEQD